MTAAHRVLVAALVVLAALYLAWFGAQRDLAAVLVFALPPLLFALGTGLGLPRAPFWSAVCALLWFSHGIMVAWSRPAEAGYALGAVALALAIVLAASLPGLRARFGRRR